MKIYNFIFCFFYELWQKKDGDGRFEGVMHVLITIVVHTMLVYRSVDLLIEKKIFLLPVFSTYGSNKTFYLILLIPFTVFIYKFYSNNKIKLLMHNYRKRYINSKMTKIINVFLILIFPMILLFYLLFKDLF